MSDETNPMTDKDWVHLWKQACELATIRPGLTEAERTARRILALCARSLRVQRADGSPMEPLLAEWHRAEQRADEIREHAKPKRLVEQKELFKEFRDGLWQ